jgi:ABC-2 type transport system permease protein
MTNLLGYCIFVFIWREVYRQGTGTEAVRRTELFAYLAMAFVLNFALTLAFESRFAQRLRAGSVTADLLRPLGFTPFQLAQAFGDAAMNLVMVFPLFLVGWLYLGAALLPPDVLHGILGLVSIALAFLVNFGISYLCMQASFVTYSSYGMHFTRLALHQVFSGLVAPLTLFPQPLRGIAERLPFRHVIDTPASVWLGLTPLECVPQMLAEQALWAVALIAISAGLLRLVLRWHQTQGG